MKLKSLSFIYGCWNRWKRLWHDNGETLKTCSLKREEQWAIMAARWKANRFMAAEQWRCCYIPRKEMTLQPLENARVGLISYLCFFYYLIHQIYQVLTSSLSVPYCISAENSLCASLLWKQWRLKDSISLTKLFFWQPNYTFCWTLYNYLLWS